MRHVISRSRFELLAAFLGERGIEAARAVLYALIMSHERETSSVEERMAEARRKAAHMEGTETMYRQNLEQHQSAIVQLANEKSRLGAELGAQEGRLGTLVSELEMWKRKADDAGHEVLSCGTTPQRGMRDVECGVECGTKEWNVECNVEWNVECGMEWNGMEANGTWNTMWNGTWNGPWNGTWNGMMERGMWNGTWNER